MSKLTIAIGSDHAGFAYKEKIKQTLKRGGHEVLDKGTFGEASVDYPDFAHPVANAVESGEANWGISTPESGQPCAGKKSWPGWHVLTTMPMFCVFPLVLFHWNWRKK